MIVYHSNPRVMVRILYDRDKFPWYSIAVKDRPERYIVIDAVKGLFKVYECNIE